jgi:hypothetical protein
MQKTPLEICLNGFLHIKSGFFRKNGALLNPAKAIKREIPRARDFSFQKTLLKKQLTFKS